MPADDLVEQFKRLASVKDLEKIVQAPVPVSQEFWRLMDKVQATPDKEEQRQLILEALRHRSRYFSTPNAVQTFVGRDGDGDGWFPFTGDVINPETSTKFDPPMAPFKHLVNRTWGGVTREYTSNFIIACMLPFMSVIKWQFYLLGNSINSAKHQWKEIAVVTNGLCGSACALVQSRLQFAEGATIFTYGGAPGHPAMDSAAFAGGNVEEYDHFWPTVMYGAIVGDILHGPWTGIGQRLRQKGAAKRHYAQTLLLPLPTKAMARFNFNMMFVKEMGPEALPREWYVMPGHKHYWYWIPTSLTDEKTWEPLQDMYIQISKESWAELRAADATTKCAVGPPTKPWAPNWELPLQSLWVVAGIAEVVCCCVCCGCIVGLMMWCNRVSRGRPPPATGAAAASGSVQVELPQIAGTVPQYAQSPQIVQQQ